MCCILRENSWGNFLNGSSINCDIYFGDIFGFFVQFFTGDLASSKCLIEELCVKKIMI